ncbi:MAG: WapI family immunity protein [Myxococcota bacterium]
MATLTSLDLRIRMTPLPTSYQFEVADNLFDLNWIWVKIRVSASGLPGHFVHTRLATWELASLAEHTDQLADGQRAMWHPRFFDSGLHLWVRRSAERNDTCIVTLVLSPVTGPLPADALPSWHADRFRHPGGQLEGARFQCSRAALALFAEELRDALTAFPVRPLQKVG